MMLREPQGALEGAAKRRLAPVVSRLATPVIVNSYGRSGSTLVCDMIVRSAVRRWLGPGRSLAERSIRGYAWDLASAGLANGQCLKTHDYPPALPDRRRDRTPRVVYLFGDPVVAAASVLRMAQVRGSAWLEEHCRHLKVQPVTARDILDRDALQLEAHFEAWRGHVGWPVAMVRYETLPAAVGRLGAYLGVALEAPEWRPRRGATELDPGELERLEATYGRFRERVEALPDFFIAGGTQQDDVTPP